MLPVCVSARGRALPLPLAQSDTPTGSSGCSGSPYRSQKFSAHLPMLHALKTLTRSWRRGRRYTAINVLGLAIGIACCLLIAQFVHHEWRYDRFHENRDQIYRLAQEMRLGTTQRIALTAAQNGPALAEQIPEVTDYVRMARRVTTVRPGADVFAEQRLLLADASFFSVFSFPLLRGTAADAPHTVVLTESAARRYFGDADPLGQPLPVDFGETTDFEVTGVMADPPPHSHLQFDAVLSFATLANGGTFPNGRQFWTYLLLTPEADPAAMPEQLTRFVETTFGEAATAQLTYFLQPLTDLHLRSEVRFDIHQGGSEAIVLVLALVAVFVLLLAAINFVNLATARASERAKEVGVRKVVGAGRSELMRQFLAESVLLTLLATTLGVGLAALVMPAFAAFAGRTFAAGFFSGPMLLGLVGGAGLLGLLAGSYPALVLSRFRPVQVLKGQRLLAGGNVAFRQLLVGVQFVVTLGLLAATYLTFQQLDYLRGKDLGFETAHVVSVPAPGGAAQVEQLRQAWATLPGIEAMTADSRGGFDGLPRRLVTREHDTTYTMVNFFFADEHYPDVLAMDLVAGRTFNAARGTEAAQAILLNEAGVQALGFASPASAVGQRLQFRNNRWEIVGVVADFHHGSLHQAIEPVFIQLRPQALRRLLVQLRPEGWQATVAQMEAAWAEVEPERAFSYAFVEEALAALYAEDRRLGQVFGLFAGLAALIAGLGLFGLISFATARRMKEVGVRKVLGASVGSLLWLFSATFLKLLVAAFLIAAPLAYLGMDRWLGTFAYRTEIGAGAFLFAACAVLLLACLTMGFQTLRAARRNPAEVLRYE